MLMKFVDLLALCYYYQRLRETWCLNSELHELELTSMLLMLNGIPLLLVKSDVVCNWKFWPKAGSRTFTLILVLMVLFGIMGVTWYCLSPLLMLVKELVSGNVWGWLENSESNRFTLNSRNCSDDGTCVSVLLKLLYSSRLPLVESPRWFFFNIRRKTCLEGSTLFASVGNHYCLLCNLTLHKFGIARI